jgi:nucleoside-diphosphate-sugar epimerase
MEPVEGGAFLIARDDLVLVTGATGFIGVRLVSALLDRGFHNLRCFARPSSDTAKLDAVARMHPFARVDIFSGNLLSRNDCMSATREASLVFDLAAGTGYKSVPDAFMNSVVTTRNLLDASVQHGCVKRFVSVSSFAVYTNTGKPHRRLLDESCPLEEHPELRGEAYCFAKVKQEQFVREHCRKSGLPHVILRPGYVYGPGKQALTDRVGINTFGVFLHLGGSNTIPLTYVDNCAEAIALAGLTVGVDGEVFNVVDDDLPSSRQLLRLYKANVRRFRSLYIPHALSYALCYLWERYSEWSNGQLPNAFNRRRWNAYWRQTQYSNERLKRRLKWVPRVATAEGLRRYFAASREQNA